ncbi:MAG: riboflavin synthase [Melioribacteraceae bacterium]|nr:riboflavin synthase [Melioribacteraceae bacterium]
MFTGIIEEVGEITKIEKIAGGLKFKVTANKIFSDLKVDDSVAINGVCLTVTNIIENNFWADAVGETLNKTTLKTILNNSFVNLERAVRLKDRLGGHLVQGHVNGIGTITHIKKLGENYLLEIFLPSNLVKYVINEGSIAVEGISLTIAKVTESRITLSIIPHTWNNTNLKSRITGDKVNIETDVIAKYVEKLLNINDKSDKYSDEWFKKLGY